MTTDPRLVVQATPAMLNKWSGALTAETSGCEWLPAMWDGHRHLLTFVADDGRHIDTVKLSPEALAPHAEFDLYRAECLDRVARVVIETLHGAPLPGSGYSFWFDGGYLTADLVWRLSRPNSFCAAFIDPRRNRRPFVPDHGVLVEVPGLDDVPGTDTEAALAAVALSVLEHADEVSGG